MTSSVSLSRCGSLRYEQGGTIQSQRIFRSISDDHTSRRTSHSPLERASSLRASCRQQQRRGRKMRYKGRRSGRCAPATTADLRTCISTAARRSGRAQQRGCRAVAALLQQRGPQRRTARASTASKAALETARARQRSTTASAPSSRSRVATRGRTGSTATWSVLSNLSFFSSFVCSHILLFARTALLLGPARRRRGKHACGRGSQPTPRLPRIFVVQRTWHRQHKRVAFVSHETVPHRRGLPADLR